MLIHKILDSLKFTGANTTKPINIAAKDCNNVVLNNTLDIKK
jgi:hypothetical protein